jgi:hypothetical protein
MLKNGDSTEMVRIVAIIDEKRIRLKVLNTQLEMANST